MDTVIIQTKAREKRVQAKMGFERFNHWNGGAAADQCCWLSKFGAQRFPSGTHERCIEAHRKTRRGAAAPAPALRHRRVPAKWRL